MVKELIRRPTQEDVEFLIANVREEDIEEIDALDGSTIRAALEETPNLLDNSEVWEVDGKVVAMFGVTPVEDHAGVGVIWMLATKDFHKNVRRFPARSKEVIANAIAKYDFIFNYVHTKNTKSIKWLEWLGFKMNDPEPIGHKGAMFTRFEMRKCAIQ